MPLPDPLPALRTLDRPMRAPQVIEPRGDHAMVHAALEYLGRGYHLLALTGKRPNARYHETWDWDNSIHGTPVTAEEYQGLRGVFEHPTTTGIAILIPPGVLVADVDTEPAAELFQQLAGMPDTVAAKTPNGLHIWYLAPGYEASVWLGGRTLLFKGFGGYVAAPPSAHFGASGERDGTYEWITDFSHGIDWLPNAMADALRAAKALQEVEPPKLREDPRYTVVTFKPDGGFTLHMDWHLDGLCRAIIEAPDGNQNNIIAWAAMTAHDEGVPFEVAMPKLLDAALKGNHPRDRATATIRGAYKRSRRG